MNLHTIEVVAAYSSASLYGIGVLGFFIFALSLLKTGFGHFFVTAMIAPIWPLFVIFAFIRGDRSKKAAPKYIEITKG